MSSAGIQPDSRKVQAVADYPTPRSSRELPQFLGLTNYYRRFVKDYAKMARPLFELVKKSVRFQWNALANESFESLKRCLINPPVLGFPDFHNQFILHTDASDTAIGAVLSQRQTDKKCVVAYWSRQLQKSERNTQQQRERDPCYCGSSQRVLSLFIFFSIHTCDRPQSTHSTQELKRCWRTY